jgi:hypothetical protein
MADYRAIAAVSEVSQARYLEAPQYFDNELEFKIYLAKDFAYPMSAGVSLFHFRINANRVLRNPRGRPGPEGRPNAAPCLTSFLDGNDISRTTWGGCDVERQSSRAGE